MHTDDFKKRFIKARRAFIESDFSRLNDMQKNAALATEGPLLLLAGAGSGKTTVLINRIANLIRYGRGSDTQDIPENITEEDLIFLESAWKDPKNTDRARAVSLCALDPVDPWRIIVITFTNKAADELKTRLSSMLGEGAQDIWAMTFHSACSKILRRDIDKIGYSRSFTIYDSDDSVAIVKRIMKELDIDDKNLPPRSVLSAISRAKDTETSPEDYKAAAEKAFDIRKKNIASVYSEYVRRLKVADALDFDDLILMTVRLLSECDEVREHYQRLFKYVLVDEYQDTDRLQYKLVSLLAGARQNICVVGDDDQSIYRFRGATIENILSFEEQYKNARTIKLEQNYRSTGHILEAANSVISNNTGRKSKHLWTDLGVGDKVCLYISENDDDEASYVAGKILDGVSNGMKFKDFAVLYRMNAQSNRLEFAFKRSGIPYKVIGGTRFFERAEIKDIMSYLCVINNPADDLRLLRIVNTPARGIGQTTIEKVRTIASKMRDSIFNVMRTSADFPELSKVSSKLTAFTSMIEFLSVSLEAGMPLDTFYDTLLAATRYTEALGNTDEALARKENIEELKSNIISYTQRAPEPTLAGFLDETALYTDIDQYEPDDNAAVLMTMHAAKGLEFPSVFIIGFEDGIFPSIRSIGESEEMEEERRLCYVAMTRARRQLTITAARRRMLFGRTSSNMLSRFSYEIPQEHIVRLESPRRNSFMEFGSSTYGESLDEYYSSSYGMKASRGSWEGSKKSTGSYSTPDPEYLEYRRRESAPQKAPAKKAPISAPAAPKAVLMDIKVGDVLEHKAFGRGTVTDLVPMSGDALLTVEFETSGSKRLMLKAAGAFIKKITD